MVPSGVFSSWAVPAATVPSAARRSAASASERARSSSSPRLRSDSLIRREKVEMNAAATTKPIQRPRRVSRGSSVSSESSCAGNSCSALKAAMLASATAMLQRAGRITAPMVMCTR